MSANINDLMAARFGSGNINDAFYQWLARSSTIPAIGMIAGRYYGYRTAVPSTPTTLALASGFHYATRFWVPAALTVDQIAINVTATGTATGLRLGLYSATAAGVPDALLVDSGELSPAVTGIKTATIDVDLTAGTLYFLSVLTNGTCTVTAGASTVHAYGVADASDITGRDVPYRSGTAYGALPASFGTHNGYSASAPNVVVRAV